MYNKRMVMGLQVKEFYGQNCALLSSELWSCIVTGSCDHVLLQDVVVV